MGRSTREFWTEPVAEIIEQVLLKGDAAVLELTERFDHAQLGPDQLRVDPNELEASIGVLEPDVLGGLRTAIANVKAVAKAQVRDEPVTVSLAEGHTVEIVEHPVQRAAVYVPGGRAPYPSTVVMGAVTARAAGVREIAVCAPPGPGGRAHPVILAACVLCEVTEVYRMGGAQAIAALAFGTESVKAVDVIVGPGNPFVQEAKRQLVGQVGIDGIAGPSELVVIAAGAGADPELIALDLMAQAEHGEDSTVWCLSPDAKLLDAVAETIERLLPGRSSVANAELRLIDVGDVGAALSQAEQIAPEHLQLMGEEAEALADRVRNAGCLFVGARRCHGLRRLRRRLEPRAAHRWRRSLPVGSLARDLPAAHGPRILAARGGEPPRARRRRSCACRGLSCARRIHGAPRVSRTSQIHRTTGETDVQLSLDLDGTGAGERETGVGFFDHLLDAVARHGLLDLDVRVEGDLETGPHHTVEDTGIALGQAIDEALGDRAGIRRFGHAVVPMDEARASAAIDISGRPFMALEGDFGAERVGDFDTDLAEEFFRAVANAAKLTLHVRLEAGTNAHHMVEASFKAFARALRAAVEDDERVEGVPSTKGVL